jgi:hypothetical protein
VVKEDRRPFLQSLRGDYWRRPEWSTNSASAQGRPHVWSRSVASRLGIGGDAVWNGYW